MRLIPVLGFANLMLSTLTAGVFFGTHVSLGPSTKTFTPETYVEVQQATIRNLRPVMGPLLPLAVLVSLATTIRESRRGAKAPLMLSDLGFIAQLTSLIVTVVRELPINARVMTWSAEAPPPEWEKTRNSWAQAHTLRTVTSVLGFACLAAGTLASSHHRTA